MTPNLVIGQITYDRWWPWRFGRVIKQTKTRIHVRWFDGEVWKYDRQHQQFLMTQ